MKRLLCIALCLFLLISTIGFAEALSTESTITKSTTTDIKTVDAPRFVKLIDETYGTVELFEFMYLMFDDDKLSQRDFFRLLCVRGAGECIIDIINANGEAEIYPEGKEVVDICTGINGVLDDAAEAAYVVRYEDGSGCVILIQTENYNSISYYHTDSADEYIESSEKILWYSLSKQKYI